MIISIVGYAAMSILLHSITDLPKPAAGRYLHGSLTIEIIGVEPLTSRFPLILWDIVVLLLQLASFSVNFTALRSDEDDDHEPLKSSDFYAYSGHLLVRDIGIIKSLRENWARGQTLDRTESESIASATTATSATGVDTDP